MINVGGLEVKSIYIGGVEVVRGYCGGSMFYEKSSVTINNVRSYYSSGSFLSARGDNYLRVIGDVIVNTGGVISSYTDVELTPVSVSSPRLIISGNYIYGQYLADNIVGSYTESVDYCYSGSGSASVAVRQGGNTVVKSFTISINDSSTIAASGGERYIDLSDMGLYYSSGYTGSETIDPNDVVFDSIVSSEVSSMTAQVDYGSIHDFDIYFPDFYKTLSQSGYYDIRCSVDGVTSNLLRVNHSANSMTVINDLWTTVYGQRTDYWEMDDASAGVVPVKLYDAVINRYTSGAESVSGEYVSAAGWTVYDDDGMIAQVDEVDDVYNVYINSISTGSKYSSIEFSVDSRSCNIDFYQEADGEDPEAEGEGESESSPGDSEGE